MPNDVDELPLERMRNDNERRSFGTAASGVVAAAAPATANVFVVGGGGVVVLLPGVVAIVGCGILVMQSLGDGRRNGNGDNGGIDTGVVGFDIDLDMLHPFCFSSYNLVLSFSAISPKQL